MTQPELYTIRERHLPVSQPAIYMWDRYEYTFPPSDFFKELLEEEKEVVKLKKVGRLARPVCQAFRSPRADGLTS